MRAMAVHFGGGPQARFEPFCRIVKISTLAPAHVAGDRRLSTVIDQRPQLPLWIIIRNKAERRHE